MSEQLELRYVALSEVRCWDRNPKRHDMGGIIQSIERHGFKDPPKFEPTLNDGAGGLVEGNGRDEALAAMRQSGYAPPRGILVKDGEWYLPILFGVDAESQAAAESYAVDHNNLVMAGGDFTDLDMAKLWDSVAYAEIIRDLAEVAELPVSLDETAVDSLLAALLDGAADNLLDVKFKEYDESVENDVEYHECPSCGNKWPK